MGLIKAVAGSLSNVLAEQWRDYFYCSAISESVLVVRGKKRQSNYSSNTHAPENIISNGAIASVADGQCMMIVEQGKVVEVCAEPGEFIYDASTEPTIFYGPLSKSVKDVLRNIGKRFTFGGEAPQDQRIYYFNVKEMMGNKYGTATPIPFRVVDRNIGLDVDISITCFGEFSYRIVNPVLFYTNVCGNIEVEYKRDSLDDQLESEFLTALQPAFSKISEMGIRYSSLPGHTDKIANVLNEVLSERWGKIRGLELVSVGLSGIKALNDDEKMIKELQRSAVFKNPGMAAAQLVSAQSAAIQAAASNESAGAAMAFMGMSMASNANSISAEKLFQMAPSEEKTVFTTGESWDCSCGATAVGNFCPNCGNKKPEKKDTWKCACGAVNQLNFCSMCGAKRPEPVSEIKCKKCGWESRDTHQPYKFCPECGAPLDN